MNLRCFYCQTPFTLGRAEVLAALQRMDAENLNHYDAHCPRCRRANSVSRLRLEMSFPNWRQVAAEQAVNPPVPAEEKPMSTPVAVTPAAAVVPAKSEPPSKPARKRAGSATKTAPKFAAVKSKAKPADKAKASPKTAKKPTARSTKK